MSDLETRLADALRDAGERAPHAGDLVTPARARLRRRRRTTAVVVAAAVAVVAIPVGVQLARQVVGPDVTTAVPDGWRTESFRDLTLEVPSDWGYQGGPDWCLGTGEPAITRTEGFVVNAACQPRFTYGVQFGTLPVDVALRERPRDVPDDAVMGLVGTTQAHAWIVAESEEQLAQIEASAHEIDGVDANGCPVMVDPEFDGSGPQVSLCRYDSGELEQSELLSVEESAALLHAIEESPRDPDPGGYLICPPYSYEQPLVTLRSEAVQANILPSTGCPLSDQFSTTSGYRLVTEDVLYWALPPGWQMRDSSLPIPEMPRH